MGELKEESEEDYQKQFSQWDKCLKANKVDSVEALYSKIHAAIKKDPSFQKKAEKKSPNREHKKFRKAKVGRKARKARADNAIKEVLSSQ